MISVYKRDSDANSNALSQDTAFNGIKVSTDKRVKSSAKKKFRVCRRFEFVGQYSKQNRTEEKRCKKAG